MTIQISAELESELQALAQRSHASVDEIAESALADFVAWRRDLNEAVRRGDEDIAAGRVHSQEEVEAYIFGLLDRA